MELALEVKSVGEISSRLSYTSTVTNANQWKWRQRRVSADQRNWRQKDVFLGCVTHPESLAVGPDVPVGEVVDELDQPRHDRVQTISWRKHKTILDVTRGQFN